MTDRKMERWKYIEIETDRQIDRQREREREREREEKVERARMRSFVCTEEKNTRRWRMK